jgi:hypothetical protein
MIKKILNYIENKIIDISDRNAFYTNAALMTEHAHNSSEPGISDTRYCDTELIVSLTTYGRRFYDVYLTVESIMRQTVKPNKIILWLAADEFSGTELPVVLQKQQKRGLEIKYCKDVLSYKKLIPALKEHPAATIITIDDDNIYYFDLIEKLLSSYKANPGHIHCCNMHRMKLAGKNTLAKYNDWTRHYDGKDASLLNFPTGGGGVLYPPGCFDNEIFNEEVFMGICRHADDVWFKAMSLMKKVMSVKVPTHKKNGKDYYSNDNVQDTALALLNYRKKLNDIQLKAVFDKYDLYKYLEGQ